MNHFLNCRLAQLVAIVVEYRYVQHQIGNRQLPIGNVLSSFEIKLRLRRLAVVRQRAFRTDRIWSLEDPVLPGGQTAVDLCVHRFRTSKTQRRFHAG